MGEGLGVRVLREVSKSSAGTILPGCLTLERSADGPRPQHVESGETSETFNPQSHSDVLRPGTGRAPERLLDIVSVFEAAGAHANKKIGDAELQAIEMVPVCKHQLAALN